MRLGPALMVAFGLFGVLLVAGAPDPWSLTRRLGGPSARGRDEAARELLRLGPAAAPALDAASASTDPDVRARARALSALVRADPNIRERQVEAAVRDALLTPDGLDSGSSVDVRVAALVPESSRALADAARRIAERGFVSRPLACALARHATRESLTALAEFVRDERVAPSSALRAAAELDAAFAGDRSVAGSIRSVATDSIETLDAPMRARSPSTRRAAVALYGALAGEAGAARIADASFDSDGAVRAECARVMGFYAPAESASTLRELAADPIASVREAALTALLRVPGVPHPEPAVATAVDVSPAVRAAAARLLGRDATPDSLCVLAALAVDSSSRVRAEARRSLASLR